MRSGEHKFVPHCYKWPVETVKHGIDPLVKCDINMMQQVLWAYWKFKEEKTEGKEPEQSILTTIWPALHYLHLYKP